MNKKIVDKKFICPHCEADLKKVGLKNIQKGQKWFDCIINDKGEIGEWQEYIFMPDDVVGEFHCGNCGYELNLFVLKELGITY